jgi:glycosyltransferase involved in cell wall biosynthesis
MSYLNNTVSVIAQSPDLDTALVDVVVTLPTYKRPEHVLRTLQSVMAQKTSRNFAIILIENDADGREGVQATEALFQSGQMKGTLIVAHDRGNCNAYNAGWHMALQLYPNFKNVIVIDDDEIADLHWLERMCAASETFGVDIVGAPQLPIFERPEHGHLTTHPVFSPPFTSSGPVAALYSSGNLLVSRKVLETMPFPYFDLKFNFIGGGDADLMNRAVQKGFKLAWCNEAPVYETVPARRTEADWIRARALRNGAISTFVEKRMRSGQPFGRAITMVRSLVLLAVSPVRAMLWTIATGSPRTGMYHIYIGVGRVLGEFGYSNEQYRNAEKN